MSVAESRINPLNENSLYNILILWEPYLIMQKKEINDNNIYIAKHTTYMKHKKENYKGRQIEYDVPSDDQENAASEIRIKIDEKDLHVLREDDGSYTTHFLPFQAYKSVEEISKDVIDKVPAFRKQES